MEHHCSICGRVRPRGRLVLVSRSNRYGPLKCRDPKDCGTLQDEYVFFEKPDWFDEYVKMFPNVTHLAERLNLPYETLLKLYRGTTEKISLPILDAIATDAGEPIEGQPVDRDGRPIIYVEVER